MYHILYHVVFSSLYQGLSMLRIITLCIFSVYFITILNLFTLMNTLVIVCVSFIWCKYVIYRDLGMFSEYMNIFYYICMVVESEMMIFSIKERLHIT